MKKYTSCVREHNGVPTLFVNDEPIFLAAPYPKAEEPYEGGKKIVNPIPSKIYCLRSPLGLRQDGTADISAASDVVDRFLAWKPDSIFVFRTVPLAPGWWLDANPDEEMVFDKEIHHLPGYAEYRDASVGSEKWLATVCQLYASFCGQLHKKYGGRIIGYQFGGGAQGENGPIGACTNDNRWFCNDFSGVMTRHFRRWLKAKYQTNKALQKAWSDESVSFANAEVPHRIERMKSEWFTFRSPLRSQTADFYSAYAERIEDTVIAICSSIKKATKNECLAGSHLGAFMDQGLHAYMLHQTAPTRFQRAVRHPNVDTFTSPCSYIHKGPGGDCTPMAPLGSIQLHGKLRLQDQDTMMSTGFSEKKMTREQEILYYAYYKMPANIAESVELLKRDVGHALIRGYGLWWHSLRAGMYDNVDVVKTISRLQRIGERSLALPRGINAALAVITDQRSAFHQQCANRLSYPMMYYQRQYFWSRTGVGWNVFVHDDLDHPRMASFPVYLFLNTFYLTAEDVKRIEKKVRKSNATVVWTYALGIQSPSGFDLKRVERLTGFRLKAVDIEALPRITVTNYDHPYTRGLGNGTENHGSAFSFGTVCHLGSPDVFTNDEREGIMGPIIYVDDKDATVLGELDCLREPGFCVKKMDGWTSIYVSAPMLTARILRNIMQASGVHIYSESEDVFYPGKSFLMMHTLHEGKKVIKLPAATDVYDCWANRIVGRNITQFEAEMPAKSTGLYYTGALEAWKHSASA